MIDEKLINLIGDVLAKQPEHTETIDEAIAIAEIIRLEFPWIDWPCRRVDRVYQEHLFKDPLGGPSDKCWDCGADKESK